MSATPQASAVHAAPALRLTTEERAAFDRDGFVIRRGMVSPEELKPLADACLGDPEIDGALVGREVEQALQGGVHEGAAAGRDGRGLGQPVDGRVPESQTAVPEGGHLRGGEGRRGRQRHGGIVRRATDTVG